MGKMPEADSLNQPYPPGDFVAEAACRKRRRRIRFLATTAVLLAAAVAYWLWSSGMLGMS